MSSIYRAWINNPSKLQPHHKLHGAVCIAHVQSDNHRFATVYFTEGPVISIRIETIHLSKINDMSKYTKGQRCGCTLHHPTAWDMDNS